MLSHILGFKDKSSAFFSFLKMDILFSIGLLPCLIGHSLKGRLIDLLEYLSKDFHILLWNSHGDGSSVLGGCSYLEGPYLVRHFSSGWLFLMRRCLSTPS